MNDDERKPSDVAAEAVVWSLIADVAKERKDEARAWLSMHMGADVAAVKAIANGDNIGRVNWVESKPALVVSDAQAFLEYVASHYPGEIVTTVNQAFQKAFLADLKVVDGIPLDAGEAVPGVELYTKSPYVSVSKAKEARDRVEDLLSSGRLGLEGIRALEGDPCA